MVAEGGVESQIKCCDEIGFIPVYEIGFVPTITND